MIPRCVRPFIVALNLLLMAMPLLAQTARPADLDEYVARSMKTFDVPGMAVAIVKDGKVVVSKGYAFANSAKQLPSTKTLCSALAPTQKRLPPRHSPHWWTKGKFPGTTLSTSA
jgi:CubicO group peptidase (beta-lactamase class C family)